MAAEHLLATLEQTLRQTRQSRARLAARLSELEQEATNLQTEIAEMDELTMQTEETLYRFMSNVLGGARGSMPVPTGRTGVATQTPSPVRDWRGTTAPQSPSVSVRRGVEPVAAAQNSLNLNNEHETEENVTDDRFTERTIPQATAALLREAGGPLHVNDIYQHLRAGGFTFSGHNPTISIAVSLNRNRRFRKVAPGTFDLVIREAASQAS